MKKIDEIISENKENIYLWDDKETIDIVVNDENKTFIEELLEFKCLKCDEDIIKGNEELIQEFTENVNGIQIECNSCNQKLFIHKPIKF